MSFNASDKSGEAINFDPTILIPFGSVGKGLSAIIRTPLGGITSGLSKEIIRLTKGFETSAATPASGFLETIKGFFSKPATKIAITATGSAGGAVAARDIVTKGTSQTIPKFNIGGKAAVTGTALSALGLASIYHLETPEGKQQYKDTIGLAGSVTDFVKQNPYILLIGLGIIGVMVLKK